MSEILYRLNEDEYSIINVINSLSGTMEYVDRRLIELGIPQKYNNIYIRYSNYYKESGDIEALKRMIFIQWYGASEPLTFTGIGMLDEKLIDEALKVLPSLLLDDGVDAEFNIMMLHYYSITDWYFDSHFDLSNWARIKSKQYNVIDLRPDFDDRGQMGKYWNSIIGNKRYL